MKTIYNKDLQPQLQEKRNLFTNMVNHQMPQENVERRRTAPTGHLRVKKKQTVVISGQDDKVSRASPDPYNSNFPKPGLKTAQGDRKFRTQQRDSLGFGGFSSHEKQANDMAYQILSEVGEAQRNRKDLKSLIGMNNLNSL